MEEREGDSRDSSATGVGGEGGALVPAVKSVSVVAPPSESAGVSGEEAEVSPMESDKDAMCPICMQMIKDAFLTACGHSFCFMCITTHLRNKSDCPCCARHLTKNQLYPNFLLDKL